MSDNHSKTRFKNMGVVGALLLFAWWGAFLAAPPSPASAPVPQSGPSLAGEDSNPERLDSRTAPQGEALPPGDLSPPGTAAMPASQRLSPVDPCAENEGERARVDALEEMIRARLAELYDRAQVALAGENISTELRTALTSVLGDRTHDLHLLEALRSAPDRAEDGFDFLTNLALADAVRLEQGDAPARSWRARIELAQRSDPSDPAPLVLRALYASKAGERIEFREALAEAFRRDTRRLLPGEAVEPALAAALAGQLSRTIDLEGATAALDSFLHTHPRDTPARVARERIRRRLEGIGERRKSVRVGRVSVLFAQGLDERSIREVASELDRHLISAARVLGVEPRREMALLVYRDVAAMQRAVCGTQWTRAAFDGSMHAASSLLEDADRSEVLRHESLHAALHDAIPRSLPFWVDEGLAQYFGGSQGDRDVEHSFERIVRSGFSIPFPSLEGSFLDIEDAGDARLAYHQSLAMILWLVDTSGESGVWRLVRALAAPQRADDAAGGDAERLLSEASGRPFGKEALVGFLQTRLQR